MQNPNRRFIAPAPPPAPAAEVVPRFMLPPGTPAPDPSVAQLEAAALSGLDAIGQLVAERNKASEAFRMTQAELTKVQAKNQVLERQVQDTAHRLDHYQRLASALLTRLNDIAGIIDMAVHDSRSEAHIRPSKLDPTPGHGAPDLTCNEDERLRDLVKRLSPDPNPEPI